MTDTDEWARRGKSFGVVAAQYARHRPQYPEAAVRWCLAGADPVGLRVLDLGAGTGKLASVLVGLGADVTAVEPDGAMLAELRRELPSVRALPGSAESILLPDGAVDAVLCGQALHWFDLSRALPEIARVLVPGGVLGALWNCDDDRVPWVAGLQQVVGQAVLVSLSSMRASAAQFSTEQFGSLFGVAASAEFPYAQPLTADALVELVSTHSGLVLKSPAERDLLLGEVASYLSSREETSSGPFSLPLVTRVVRADRVQS